jgi:hypothetical protein
VTVLKKVEELSCHGLVHPKLELRVVRAPCVLCLAMMPENRNLILIDAHTAGTSCVLHYAGDFKGIADYIQKSNPYYYELDPIMKGRPNAKPLALTEDTSSSSSSSSDDKEPSNQGTNEEDFDSSADESDATSLPSNSTASIRKIASGTSDDKDKKPRPPPTDQERIRCARRHPSTSRRVSDLL